MLLVDCTVEEAWVVTMMFLRSQRKIKSLWMDGKTMDKVRRKWQAWRRFKRHEDNNSYTDWIYVNEKPSTMGYQNGCSGVWEIRHHRGKGEWILNHSGSMCDPERRPERDWTGIDRTRDGRRAADLPDWPVQITRRQWSWAPTTAQFLTHDDKNMVLCLPERRTECCLDRIFILEEDVEKNLKAMKTSNSPGPDNIYPRELREAATVLCKRIPQSCRGVLTHRGIKICPHCTL